MQLQKPMFRVGTWDDQIFHCVSTLNEYKLPPDLSGFICIDIGGHIGSFTWACLERGADMVVYVEALKKNYDICGDWVSKSGVEDKVLMLNRAIWISSNEQLHISECVDVKNTGGGSVLGAETGQIVKTIDMNQILHFDLVRFAMRKPFNSYNFKKLLKLDCEGGEFAVFGSPKNRRILSQYINYICGEYHESTARPENTKGFDLESLSYDQLSQKAKAAGFIYQAQDRSQDQSGQLLPLGHFWYSGDDSPFFIDNFIPLELYKQ